MPFTGYATFLYRNLTVLKAAGIDPTDPITDWTVWLEQMKAIKRLPETSEWAPSTMTGGISPTFTPVPPLLKNGVSISLPRRFTQPEKYIETVKFLEAAKAYGTDNGDQDQATTDLFLSNKLAFVHGPLDEPNL